MVGGIVEFNTYLENQYQLKKISQTSIREVILEHKLLSRLGKNNTSTTLSLLEQVLSCGMTPVLQWDILSTDDAFEDCIAILNNLPLSNFHAIRIQDLGAAEWMRQENPDIPIHLIVETGNHNLVGLLRWSEHFGKQLKRLILSTELPKSKLIDYCNRLKTPCEILCVGRILLFYSPRKLLSKYKFLNDSVNFIEKNLFTDEKPQKLFPTIENHHGTFMFFNRDLFLLDHLPELLKTNLKFLRIDLRHIDKSFNWINEFHGKLESFDKKKISTLKSSWPFKITHGFFRANRSDLAINRIKNPFLKNRGDLLVGYVVEAVKEEHIILLARKRFSCGDNLLAITPEGRECEIFTNVIHTTSGDAVTEIIPENLYKVPFVKYVTAQTLIYKNHESENLEFYHHTS